MVKLRKRLPVAIQEWSRAFSASGRLEAPDRKFIGHRDILIRSLARSHFVAPHVHGALLEVGCGRGYGFEVLAPRSTAQVGIDLSRSYLKEAQVHFPTISFARASGTALPFSDCSFDSIVAFEVIEHIEEDLVFLHELKRLARNQAFITVSTPNKLVASGNREKPLNSFHAREYTSTEFYALLSQVFSSVQVFGQHERSGNPGSKNSLMDRIPIRWKYLVPTYIQCIISVALRPPLRLEECRFQPEDLDNAHTFVALCRP